MIKFEVDFVADDRRSLAAALRSYATRIEREEVNGPNGCVGSPECGSSYFFDANWEPPEDWKQIKEELSRPESSDAQS